MDRNRNKRITTHQEACQWFQLLQIHVPLLHDGPFRWVWRLHKELEPSTRAAVRGPEGPLMGATPAELIWDNFFFNTLRVNTNSPYFNVFFATFVNDISFSTTVCCNAPPSTAPGRPLTF